MKLIQLLFTELPADNTYAGVVNPILRVLNDIIFPILLVVAAVGTIYAIYLAVLMAKAENADKREEAKRKVINVVISVIVMVVLILLLQLFINNADKLFLSKVTDPGA